MGPCGLKFRCGARLWVVMLLGVLCGSLCSAQEIKLNVTYVCDGERLHVESCNIRDLSDTATCQVAHPDRPLHNGFMAYTSETRGALKKLLATCKQPSAQEQAAADAFQKKQQAIYDANAAKANGQVSAPARAQTAGGSAGAQQIAPPKNAEERAMRRCVSSGRLPATCTGNSLLGAFGAMLSQVLPSAAKEATAGPEMAGVFQGAGGWRLDFVDGGVLVNCGSLSPNQEGYSVDFKDNRAVITVATKPKPLVLSLRGNETMVGLPGPVTIDGVVATGTARSGPDPNARSGYTDKNGISLTNQQAASAPEVYQGANQHYGPVTAGGSSYATFSPRQATCPAVNLSSKGAGVGVQTMQTDLLKSVFSDGDKGPPTPVGLRMHGIFAASTGFSAQFFPESVVLGCGPDSARAYPYSVIADGSKAVVQVNAPDHPLTLTFRPGGALDAGTGPYVVHGRIVTGQNDNDDFTFAPMEQTCNLAVLTPSKEIPSGGGVAATMVAAGSPAAGSPGAGGGLSVPEKPLGNAVLSIVSGVPGAAGAASPLAGRPYILLRDSYANVLAKGGVSVPAGVSPYVYAGTACAPTRTPDCQKISTAVNTSAASAVRADGSGKGTFPGVPPGTYYLMISARYNNQSLVWGQAVQLKPGANTLTLDPKDATPVQ
jgi:hypothetical protein